MESVVLVVVAPEGAADSLEKELVALGVEGYTAWPVRGFGHHGRRPTQWSTGNVRIEALTSRSLAESVAAVLHQRHPAEHGVFVYAYGAVAI